MGCKGVGEREVEEEAEGEAWRGEGEGEWKSVWQSITECPPRSTSRTSCAGWPMVSGSGGKGDAWWGGWKEG